MSVIGNGISGLLEAVNRLGSSMAMSMEVRLQRLRAAVRTEVRFAASAFALGLAAAAFVVTALFFAASAIMMAAWNTHPIMAAALIAMAFAILAVVAALLLRGNTR